MGYNTQISRTDADALIPEQAAAEIIKGIDEGSSVLKLAKALPNMSSDTYKMPVLSLLPEAYFVGERGKSNENFASKKQTTRLAWENKYIYAEEIAAIVVVPEAVIEDASYDVWGEIKPSIVNAIGKKIDEAILYGDNASDVPTTWPDGVFTGMPDAHQIELNSVDTDLYDDIFSLGGVFNQVEADGYFVTGNLAGISMRARLRGLRDGTTGLPIFQKSMQDPTQWELDGTPVIFPRNGAYDETATYLISGDWSQLVYSIRKDVTYKVLTEGVITDASSPPQIQFNLAQEDLVGLRVVFRMGWQLPNPINPVNTNASTRYPFAALVPATSS